MLQSASTESFVTRRGVHKTFCEVAQLTQLLRPSIGSKPQSHTEKRCIWGLPRHNMPPIQLHVKRASLPAESNVAGQRSALQEAATQKRFLDQQNPVPAKRRAQTRNSQRSEIALQDLSELPHLETKAIKLTNARTVCSTLLSRQTRRCSTLEFTADLQLPCCNQLVSMTQALGCSP